MHCCVLNLGRIRIQESIKVSEYISEVREELLRIHSEPGDLNEA